MKQITICLFVVQSHLRARSGIRLKRKISNGRHVRRAAFSQRDSRHAAVFVLTAENKMLY